MRVVEIEGNIFLPFRNLSVSPLFPNTPRHGSYCSAVQSTMRSSASSMRCRVFNNSQKKEVLTFFINAG